MPINLNCFYTAFLQGNGEGTGSKSFAGLETNLGSHKRTPLYCQRWGQLFLAGLGQPSPTLEGGLTDFKRQVLDSSRFPPASSSCLSVLSNRRMSQTATGARKQRRDPREWQKPACGTTPKGHIVRSNCAQQFPDTGIKARMDRLLVPNLTALGPSYHLQSYPFQFSYLSGELGNRILRYITGLWDRR